MSTTIDLDLLEKALIASIPQQFSEIIPDLSSLLAGLLSGTLRVDQARQCFISSPALLDALYSLRGKKLLVGTETILIAGTETDKQISINELVIDTESVQVDTAEVIQNIQVSGGYVDRIIGKQINHQDIVVSVTPLGARLDHAEVIIPSRHVKLPNPPRPLPTFLNRVQALERIRKEMRACRGAVLSGHPGCGLSSLLRQASNDPLATSFTDGVVYLDGPYESVSRDDTLQRLFAKFYDTSAITVKMDSESASLYLGDINALFAFDRLPLGRAQQMELADILRKGAVLFASDSHAPRTLLDVPLSGLPHADAQALVTDLTTSDEVVLSADLVEQLCTTLECLPLPIVLSVQLIQRMTANQGRMRSVGAHATMPLAHLVEALTTNKADPLARVVTCMIAELTADELAILRILIAVNGPDIALADLVALSKRSHAVVEDALDGLSALELVDTGDYGRYRLAAVSVRRVLGRVLDPAEDRHHAAMFFAALATQHIGDLEWLALERENLRGALDTLLAEGDHVHASSLVRAIQPELVVNGLWDGWGSLIDAAFHAADAGDNAGLRAWALHEQGTRAGLLGNLPLASAGLNDAVHLRLSLGDTVGAELSRHNLSCLGLLLPPDDGADPTPHSHVPKPFPWSSIAITTAAMLLLVAFVAFFWSMRSPSLPQLSAAPMAGSAPLAVTFGVVSAQGQQAKIYQWNFGDGSEVLTTDEPTATHTYTTVGSYTAALMVCDTPDHCAKDPATVVIDVRNALPEPVIIQPTIGSTFAAAIPISLVGKAHDSEDGDLDAATLRWHVTLHDSTGSHALAIVVNGDGVMFTVPFTASVTLDSQSFVVVELRATDSLQATGVVSQVLQPATTTFTLESEPSGLHLGINGATVVTPYTLNAWDGGAVDLAAPDQADQAGLCQVFDTWSDAGVQTHVISATDITYIARFHPHTASLARSAFEVSEADVPAEFAIELDQVARCTITVAYAARDGTAVSGADYTISTQDVQIAPGERNALIAVTIPKDGRAEDSEYFDLVLGTMKGAIAGTTVTATVTILDRDAPPEITFAEPRVSVAESRDTATIAVNLSTPSERPITVIYALEPGTATPDEDYTPIRGTFVFAPGEITHSIPITITPDIRYEEDETVILRLSSADHAELKETMATLTISNDDQPPEIRFTNTTYNDIENAGTVTIPVILSAPSQLPVSVTYMVRPDTASEGGDYLTVSGTLTFTANITSTAFTIPIIDDNADEDDEQFRLVLTTPTVATLSLSEAILTIQDNDDLPTVQFASAIYSVSEGEAVSVVIEVTPVSGKTVTVNYAVVSRGSTLSADDYSPVNTEGTLTFRGDDARKELVFQINDDSRYEPEETLILRLSNPEHAYLGERTITQIDVADDDFPRISIRGPTTAVSEDRGIGNPDTFEPPPEKTAFIAVSLDHAPAQDVTVNYATMPGTAEPEVDYRPVTETLTFPAGAIGSSLTMTVTVAIIDDGRRDEDDETFTVYLSDPHNATLAQVSRVDVTISDPQYVLGSPSTPSISINTPSPKQATPIYNRVQRPRYKRYLLM